MQYYVGTGIDPSFPHGSIIEFKAEDELAEHVQAAVDMGLLVPLTEYDDLAQIAEEDMGVVGLDEIAAIGEPLVGWRIFTVEDSRIFSPQKADYVWEPMQEASCHDRVCFAGSQIEQGMRHPSRRTNCHCGIYAHKTREITIQQLANDFWKSILTPTGRRIAFGEVGLRGNYVEGTKGYRAEYAYPRTLYIINGTQKQALALANAYKVGVEYGPPPPEVADLIEQKRRDKIRTDKAIRRSNRRREEKARILAEEQDYRIASQQRGEAAVPPGKPLWLDCEHGHHQWDAGTDKCVWCGTA